jgi:hypothetical protein
MRGSSSEGNNSNVYASFDNSGKQWNANLPVHSRNIWIRENWILCYPQALENGLNLKTCMRASLTEEPENHMQPHCRSQDVCSLPTPASWLSMLAFPTASLFLSLLLLSSAIAQCRTRERTALQQIAPNHLLSALHRQSRQLTMGLGLRPSAWPARPPPSG